MFQSHLLDLGLHVCMRVKNESAVTACCVKSALSAR